MRRELSFEVAPSEAGRQCGSFLRLKGISHTLLVMIKRQGALYVNGAFAYSNRFLEAGDIVRIACEEETYSTNIAPEPGAIDVLYEDEDLLALSKPAGLAVHPSRAHVYGTLANRVMYYYSGCDFTFRAVNRLDLGTSGIVLIAKNPFSANWFHERSNIVKEYTGFCKGEFPDSIKTIDLPIRRSVEGIKREVVVDDSAGSEIIMKAESDERDYKPERAVTHCRVCGTHEIEGSADGESKLFTEVCFVLETGRTHQIRVHSSYLGYPLLGDRLYNPFPDEFEIARQALHAAKVTLTLPYSDKRIVIKSPLPEDMKRLIDG